MEKYKQVAEVHDALMTLRPNCRFSVKNNDIEQIEWMEDDIDLPSREEIQAEIQRLQEVYDSLWYKKQRKDAYPSIADQLDTLYHQGYDGWKEQIQAIKDKYPK
jgi:hypothetical protein